MAQSDAETWSIARSLALLAAVFAMVFGSLMPFAAMAAAQPGQPFILCTTEGPQVIHSGGLDGPVKMDHGAKCAACVLPLVAALPPVPLIDLEPQRLDVSPAVYSSFVVAALPPARAPPCPPSTAPPLS